MVILPVDQGFEHGPARSFAPNPPAYDPRYHFQFAIDAGCNALAAPLGAAAPQPDYVNAVAALVTSLAAPALLERMRTIEHRHGRPPAKQRVRNAARTLDLDLLLFGRRRSRQRQLTLPHPRMHQRAFVLRPLLDVAPAAVIPGRGAARRWLRGLHGQRIARTRRHTRL
jgi:2-amino-4-hydroxy-6-hydroxymethyldihydropteridine diphosphokinase